MVSILKKIHNYGENTTIHGIRQITNPNLTYFERFLWVLIFLSSIYGTYVIFKATYEAYETEPISFATETSYLNWNTTFPAVSFCQLVNPDIFSGDEAKEKIVQTFISEIAFFTGTCFSCKDCTKCKNYDLKVLARQYRKSCERLLNNCTWNGEKFDCCEKFKPLETEYGVCYSINSLFHGEPTLVSNRFEGPGELYVSTNDDARVFFHAPEDVPFINADPEKRDDVLIGDNYIKRLRIVEIENDMNVKNVAIEKRGCRFFWETPKNMRVHKYYSYSSCIVQCHADAQMKNCGCVHHLIPNTEKNEICDLKGLRCLTENYELLNRLQTPGTDNKGLKCDCLPSCTEPEYGVVFKENGVARSNGHVRIILQSLPTQRYKRNVVRSTLDLVVSIGGTAGLFFGASILSLLETLYFVFRRN